MKPVLTAHATVHLQADSRTAGFATHWLAVSLLLGVVLLWGGLLALAVYKAALPEQATGTVVVVFPPTMPADQVFAGVLHADGVLARETWFENVWIVYSNREGFVGRLKSQGALIIFAPVPFDSVAVGGCFGVAPPRLR